jgi:hypothetical protein
MVAASPKASTRERRQTEGNDDGHHLQGVSTSVGREGRRGSGGGDAGRRRRAGGARWRVQWWRRAQQRNERGMIFWGEARVCTGRAWARGLPNRTAGPSNQGRWVNQRAVAEARGAAARGPPSSRVRSPPDGTCRVGVARGGRETRRCKQTKGTFKNFDELRCFSLVFSFSAKPWMHKRRRCAWVFSNYWQAE